MQEVVANVDQIRFDLEVSIENQVGIQALPFTGMDKSGAPVCHFFKMNSCMRGANCPYRHIVGEKATVCKHWLRGLCKKGDQCEFLHEYDMSKMPECYFYQKYRRCDNKDCEYQHINPSDKVKDCPWYDRGFCKHGPSCKYRHRRKVMCTNYLVGLCVDGPKCKFTHPRWELPNEVLRMTKCNRCQEPGHKATMCTHQGFTDDESFFGVGLNGGRPLVANVKRLVDHIFEQREKQQGLGMFQPGGRGSKAGGMPKDMSRITCFKCNRKGHYASRCPDLFPPTTSQPTITGVGGVNIIPQTNMA